MDMKCIERKIESVKKKDQESLVHCFQWGMVFMDLHWEGQINDSSSRHAWIPATWFRRCFFLFFLLGWVLCLFLLIQWPPFQWIPVIPLSVLSMVSLLQRVPQELRNYWPQRRSKSGRKGNHWRRRKDKEWWSYRSSDLKGLSQFHIPVSTAQSENFRTYVFAVKHRYLG